MSAFAEQDFERVAEAVAAAERLTAGEIRVVVSTAPAARHPVFALLWGALAALVLPWLPALFWPPPLPALLAVQAVLFVGVTGLLLLPPLAAAVTPAAVRDAAMRSAALDQFLAHGMHQTRARTGVLIYVAVAERRVEVIADEGIDALVAPGAWQEVCDAVLKQAAEGRLADGLAEGVARAGRLLAAHVPPRPIDDVNELPDRVVLL
ncbi:MAG: TPM domain-containing protein [Xanthobacteraceae bacterium]